MGRHCRALKAMIIGAGIGAGIGAFEPRDYGCWGSCPHQTKGEVVGIFVLLGALFGAGTGALIKSDRWTSVPLQRVGVSFAPTRGRGLGLSVSVAW
jgi:hypothetical protein